MPRLEISLLGPFQVTLDSVPVIHFGAGTARALLAYLVMDVYTPHRRETLAGLLWPEQPESEARHNLSRALLRLRAAIGNREVASPFLLATRETIRFSPESDYWLDVSAFEEALAFTRAHGHRSLGACVVCAERIAEAAALYRGEFLAGFSLDSAPFEEWIVVERERLHRQGLEALGRLAAYEEGQGAYEEAVRYARRSLALESWWEAGHRQVMRGLALGGDRSAALAQYEACCRALQEELGVEPEEETRRLYEQIRGGELAACIPEAKARLGHNLPTFPDPLIGRETELEEIHQLLSDPACRLLTLVGPGGIGKTHLAVEAARLELARCEDGAFFVPLAPVRSVDAIVPTVCRTLALSFYDIGDPQQQLLGHLRGKRMLLVLDNLEQLVAGSVLREHDQEEPGARDSLALVAEILRVAPGVKIVTTSRSRLNLREEYVFTVGGLAAPDWTPTTPQEALANAAIQLFLQVARRARVHREPTPDDLKDIARVCRLVEGMPLAILLAASWVDVLSSGEIADRVATNLDLLAADLGDLPARQRSMRAVFDTSWAALSEEARSAFARMSVFRGGFTAEAAQAVAGAGLRTLRELVRTSFLQRTDGGRYGTHELLRQYGAKQLDKMPEDREKTLDRHCTYYAAFYGQRAVDVWKGGIEPVAPEIGNIQAAWHCALEHGRAAQIREFVGQLIGGLHQLYYSLGWFAEAGQTFAVAVAVLRVAERNRENDVALAIALRCQAQYAADVGRREARLPLIRESIAILSRVGAMEELALSKIYAALFLPEPDEAERERLLQESLAIARETGCPFGIGWASHLLGGLALLRQAYHEGEEYLRDALDAFRRIEHRRGVSWVVASLARLACYQADYAGARVLATESMALCEQIGWPWRVVKQRLFLGEVALAQGARDEARMYYEDARGRAQNIGDDRLLVFALCGLGDAALAHQDLEEARSTYRRALEIAAQDRRPELGWRAVVGVAMLAAREGRLERAASLLALAHRAVTGPLSPSIDTALRWMDLRLRTPGLYAELQRQLPPPVFATAEERGRSVSLRATVQELLAELAS